MTIEVIEAGGTHVTVQTDTSNVEVVNDVTEVSISTPAPITIEVATGGLQGIPGRSIWAGSAPPDDLTGSDGDLYVVNVGTTGLGDTYYKSGGTWGAPTGNIRGPAGQDGTGSGTIESVNGDTGPHIVLGAEDVGAAPMIHTHIKSQIVDFDHTHPIGEIEGLQDALDNMSGGGPGPHTHVISDTTGLQDALDGKAALSHTHTISNITNLQTALDGKASTSHTHTKSQITDFTHTHAISEVTNLQSTLDGKASLSGTNTVNGVNYFTNNVHISNGGSQVGLVLGTSLLGTAATADTRKVGSIRAMNYVGAGANNASYWEALFVDSPDANTNAINIGGRAASPNTSATQISFSTAADANTVGATTRMWISNTGVVTVTGSLALSAATASRVLTTGSGGAVQTSSVTTTELGYLSGVTSAIQTQIDGKAASSHTHTKSQITDFAHTHTIADLPVATSGASSSTQLVRADDSRLSDARTPTAHTHAISDVTNLQTTLDGKAASSHTHTIANITNLQTTLDGKASTSHTHTKSQITDFAHTHTIGQVDNLESSLNLKMPVFKGGQEVANIFTGGTSGSLTADCNNGSIFLVSPTGDVTLNFTNMGAPGVAESYTVIVIQDATPREVTIGGSPVWMTPEPTQVANKTYIINILYVANTMYAWGNVQP